MDFSVSFFDFLVKHRQTLTHETTVWEKHFFTKKVKPPIEFFVLLAETVCKENLVKQGLKQWYEVMSHASNLATSQPLAIYFFSNPPPSISIPSLVMWRRCPCWRRP